MSETTTWAGLISGAGASTAIVEITRDGTRIEGQLRLFEPSIGQLHACLVGEWSDDNKLSARLEQFMGNFSTEAILPQTGSLEGVFDPDENALRGHWSTDAGTEGELWWVCVASHSPTTAMSWIPEPAVDEYAPRGGRWQRLSGRVRSFFVRSRADQGKRRTGWLAVLFGVGVAAIAGYFLMDSLLDLLLDG